MSELLSHLMYILNNARIKNSIIDNYTNIKISNRVNMPKKKLEQKKNGK